MPLPHPLRTVYIIGGSLSGLMHALAVFTHSPGTSVTILERSDTPLLHNQGAGVVAGSDTQAFFESYVRPGRPIAVISRQRLYLDRHGAIVPGSEDARPQRMTSWDVLYRLLRWRVDGTAATEYLTGSSAAPAARPRAEYRHGCALAALQPQADGVTLRWTHNGAEHTARADLVIAADGASSAVRRLLLPGVERTYAGYVAFRGTVPEGALSEEAAAAFVEKFAFFHAPGTQILAYSIPGEPGGNLARGSRLVNWVWYVNYAEGSEALAELMTDRTGKRHAVTLPVGGMREDVWRRLTLKARNELPPQFAEIVGMTEQPFVQAVTDVLAGECLFWDARVVLVGDALAGFRPHTAASTGQAARAAALLGRWMQGLIGEDEYRSECLDYAQGMQKHGVQLGERSQFGRHPLQR